MNIRYECRIEGDKIQFGYEGQPASSVVLWKDVISLGVTKFPNEPDPYTWNLTFKKGIGLGVPSHAIDEAAMIALYAQHVPEDEVRAALSQATNATERLDVILWAHPRYR